MTSNPWNCEEGEDDVDEDRLSTSEPDVVDSGPARKRQRRWSKEQQEHGQPSTQDPDRPACQYCRKKKSACSRTQPCSTCVRYSVQCVYHDRKSKPGMRTGAIESLNQRVDTLENMFIGQGLLFQQMLRALKGADVAAGTGAHQGGGSESVPSFKESIAQLRATMSDLGPRGHYTSLSDSNSSQDSGRARGPGEGSQQQGQPGQRKESGNTPPAAANNGRDVGEAALPSEDLMDELLDIYFDKVHPWIPMLHVDHLRERASNHAERPSLSTIFYAVTSLCARFSDDPRLGDRGDKAAYARRCRQMVILRSMESFSVENLQALTICAFDLIGGGRGPSAWSIVGSMTRTVEQLGLSVEVEDEDEAQYMPTGPPSSSSAAAAFGYPREPLIRRITFLPRSTTWIEAEERRRVFWNVFLMDRFCSIATGWNFSLTGADVRRRLPCEGALWRCGRSPSVPTPYFGLVDQASRLNPPVPAARPEGEDQALLGGFAFCIEATESLSLVTSFFLQYELNRFDPRQVQIWLMRFKQLDLRLVQWKICLPEQWREACVLNADGNMDPNLTLAHMTHNTAVILLHQVLAFPPPTSPLCQQLAMTSSSPLSAETCLAAAIEVATIAHEFLQRSPSALASPQFAFCLFICGRLLLAHAAQYRQQQQHQHESSSPPQAQSPPPAPATLDSLVTSLLEISQRWNGHPGGPSAEFSKGPGAGIRGSQNLASRFAMRLVDARCRGGSCNVLDIRDSVYSEEEYLEPHTTTAAAAASASAVAAAVASEARGHGVLCVDVNVGVTGICGTDAGAGGGQLLSSSSEYQHASQNTGHDHQQQHQHNHHDYHGQQQESLSSSRMAAALQGTSPDGMSMAFPPLPLALQDPRLSVVNGSAAAPASIIPAESLSILEDTPRSNGGGGVVLDNFADIDAFLDPLFLADQRISVFSYSGNATQ